MTRDEFFRDLAAALTVDEGVFSSGTVLDSIPEWDSLAVVEFQGLADESLELEIDPEKINACNTVDDLAALISPKLDG